MANTFTEPKPSEFLSPVNYCEAYNKWVKDGGLAVMYGAPGFGSWMGGITSNTVTYGHEPEDPHIHVVLETSDGFRKVLTFSREEYKQFVKTGVIGIPRFTGKDDVQTAQFFYAGHCLFKEPAIWTWPELKPLDVNGTEAVTNNTVNSIDLTNYTVGVDLAGFEYKAIDKEGK